MTFLESVRAGVIAFAKSPVAWGVLVASGGVAIAGWLVAKHWPADWDTQQEVALASALSAAFGTFIGAVWKAAFESLSNTAAHQRDVKAKLLERFLENRATYLEQLDAIAAELTSSLKGVARYPGIEYRVEFAFYHSARYVELVAALRARFQRLVPSDHMPGFVLRSQAAEQRVWRLLLEPWAFGYSTPQQQSAVLESLRKEPDIAGRRDVVSPRGFIAALADKDNSSHKDLLDAYADLKKKLEGPGYASALAEIVFVLNRLLRYEMARVLEAWYDTPARYPREEIKQAREFFCNDSTVTLEELGVTLPPDRPD